MTFFSNKDIAKALDIPEKGVREVEEIVDKVIKRKKAMTESLKSIHSIVAESKIKKPCPTTALIAGFILQRSD